MTRTTGKKRRLALEAKAIALLKYGFTPWGAVKSAAYHLNAPSAVTKQVRRNIERAAA